MTSPKADGGYVAQLQLATCGAYLLPRCTESTRNGSSRSRPEVTAEAVAKLDLPAKASHPGQFGYAYTGVGNSQLKHGARGFFKCTARAAQVADSPTYAGRVAQTFEDAATQVAGLRRKSCKFEHKDS
eukprot:3476121-Pleurochrysis_carterae.AAC.2